jgi:1-acyl-sn-glycerol-3-phosphate acyltransferase
MGPGRRFEWKDVLLWPWAPIAWLLAFAWMTVLVLVSLPVTLFIPFERFQMIWPHPQTGWTLAVTLSRVRITYDRRFDHKRPSMYVQNHVSTLDAHCACAAIPLPLCGLENAAHLKLPGYGWLMRLANAIPVEKGAGRFAQIARDVQERMSRGISILVFPEAHRTLDGKVRPFKRGVFQIARDSGIPVVPLAVRGMFEILPKGTLLIRPGKIEIYMGPQIETAGLTDDQVEELAEHVRQMIIGWVERREPMGDLPAFARTVTQDDIGVDEARDKSA